LDDPDKAVLHPPLVSEAHISDAESDVAHSTGDRERPASLSDPERHLSGPAGGGGDRAGRVADSG